MNTRSKIKSKCKKIENLLLNKNARYGDAALEPLNVFSKCNAVTSIKARIDDKLMRIKTQGFRGYGEDNIKDLIGYLILLKIAVQEEQQEPHLKEWQEDILINEGFYNNTTT